MNHEEYHAAESAFIESFRQVSDKSGLLRLARVPLEIEMPGEPVLKLLQVQLEEVFEVGRASPGFGSRELVYHPLPGKLVTSETRLCFRYVSTATVREFTLAELLALSSTETFDVTLAQDHLHGHQHHEHDHTLTNIRPLQANLTALRQAPNS